MSDRNEYMRNYRNTHKQKLDEYYKQWKKDNPDKIKLYNKRYYNKHKKQILLQKYAKRFVIEE